MDGTSTEIKQLRLIGDIVSRITLGDSFGEILDAVHVRVREIMPADRIGVGLMDPSGARITLAAVRSSGPIVLEVGTQMPLRGTNLESLLRRDETMILNDLEDYIKHHPKSVTNRKVYEEGMRSTMTVPLIIRGAPVGVLFVSSSAKGAFGGRHANFVRQIAGHLAMTIEKGRLISLLESRNLALAESKALSERYVGRLQSDVKQKTVELEKSRERYRTLLAISNTINESVESQLVFDRIVEALKPVFPVDRLGIVLAEGEGARLFTLAPRGERSSQEADDIPLQNSLTGLVLKTGESHYWPDLAAVPDVFERHLLSKGIRSYAIVPLRREDRSIGTMNISSRRAHRFSPDDVRFLDQVAEPVTLAVQNALAFREIDRLKNQLLKENRTLKRELIGQGEDCEIIGVSKLMQNVRTSIARVASTEATVLIRGATGTGKELVARAIHRDSARADQVLISVNCAALSESLIESELFGHERGAFTGAMDRRLGRFELANRGSIFLDEIGDLPPNVQVKLLRVLQEREFERVGGDETVSVDVRVIAATNRSLETAMQEGSFRADLYYRLNVFPLVVPPLRERLEDVPELALYFMRQYGQKTGKRFQSITPATIERLLAYDWPGNVRELENVIERAVILGDGPELRIGGSMLGGRRPIGRHGQSTLAEMERRYIREVLEATQGVIYGPRGAARILGLKPSTLQSRMKRLGVERVGSANAASDTHQPN